MADEINWKAKYEALRDGVLAWCDEPDWSDDPAVSPIALDRLRAVVARVEENNVMAKQNCFHTYSDWSWSATKLCYYRLCKKCGVAEWSHEEVPEGSTCG